MKTIKILLLLTLLVNGFTTSMGILDVMSPTVLNGLQETTLEGTSFLPSGPIIISGDSDFFSQGWPGDGSPQTPFVIESLEIITNDTCISISSTSVHFVIRNCTLSSPVIGSGTGIYLSYANNGTVENCTIASFDTGIESMYSDDCTISNNTLTDCSNYGIYHHVGLNNTINDNRVIDHEGYGLFLSSLRYSSVEHNNISNCSEMGLAIASTLNTTITDNLIENSGRFGLYFAGSSNCTFINNTLTNGGFGVGGDDEIYWMHYFSENTVNGKFVGYLVRTNNTEIDGNVLGQVFLISCYNVTVNSGVFFNASVGISLFSCTNCTISNIEISGNLYGINLLQSENTTLIDNSLFDCGVRFDGTDIDNWNITATGNTVNEKQFGYFLNQKDLEINGNNYGQLILVDSRNLSIVNGTFESVTAGFVVYYSFNCSISNASIVDNYYNGILLLNSNNCTLTNVTSEGSRNNGLSISASNYTIVTKCNIHGNGNAIRVSASDDFLLISNQIHDNRGSGIYLSGTNYGMIKNNSINDNGGSIRLYIVNWLEIINNTISGSSTDGIYNDFTSGVVIVGNKIYGHAGYGVNVRSYAINSDIYNNMIGFNEAGNAIDLGIFSDWDDGAGIGNVWSDYSGSGVYSVGIGTDNYPRGFVSRPDDVQYTVDETVPAITWDVRLPNPDSYMILWEHVVITQGALNSSFDHLSKAIDGLSVGIYNLTLVVNDASGYSLIDTVIITVVEETTTTTTSGTATTETTSTTTSTPTTSQPPPDSTMILIVGSVGVICTIVVLIIIIKKK